MLDRVKNLAQLIKAKKAAGDKFVLMLGAGASLSSGLKPTQQIIEELVAQYARQPSKASVEDQFDKLWASSTPDDRGAMLAPYLTAVPSDGYRHIAELIRVGYFDTIVTFNFDTLLERALDELGFRDYQVMIRGETTVEAIAAMFRNREPRVKILKLHGSLRSADYFLFAKEEMLNYPAALAEVVTELTGRDIIICGYAFSDTCVIRAFNAEPDAGSIYFVNPAGATNGIKGFLAGRRSQDKVIAGEFGRFDEFSGALFQELTVPTATAAAMSRQNLFKFLDGYQEDQPKWFLGRRRLTRQLVKKLEKPAFASLFLYGKPKVGKTSFVRAGLTPFLDASRYEIAYIRCRKDLQPQIVAELERRFSTPLAGLSWPEIAAALGRLTSKRIVLLLDQFERPCRAAVQSQSAHAALLQSMRDLLHHAGPQLGVVLVATDEIAFWKFFGMLRDPSTDLEEIAALSERRVKRIVKHAAHHGGVTLNDDYIDAICGEYARSLEDTTGERRPFTLTHVQTICYYLVKGFQPTWTGYDALPAGLLAALESVREEANFIDLLEELPADERRLIRTLLKAICDPDGNTRKVLDYLKRRFPDIKEDRYPEPIV